MVYADLFKLFGQIAVISTILTVILFFIRRPMSLPIDWIKNFVGTLFIFSGAVKAVDPLGTAYKMHDYFAAFEGRFGMKALWSALDAQSITFSIFMIVLEFALGIYLILGIKTRLTLWLTVPMMLFFTFLTGYTSITGEVTDCGCFGDFLKLKPVVSFTKDIILLLLILPLILWRDKITPIFTKPYIGDVIGLVVTGASLIFCLQNYLWDEPLVDFRPFGVGVNIPAAKAIEEEKVANVPMTWIYTHKVTGEVKEFTPDPPKDTIWKFKDRVQPEVETSKVYDFYINNEQGADNTDSLMTLEGYTFMIVFPDRTKANPEGIAKVKALAEAAHNDGIGVYAVANIGADEKYKRSIAWNYPLFTADDKLLKTMIRSIPGVILFKKGTIVNKWHYKKLPEYSAIKQTDMR